MYSQLWVEVTHIGPNPLLFTFQKTPRLKNDAESQRDSMQPRSRPFLTRFERFMVVYLKRYERDEFETVSWREADTEASAMHGIQEKGAIRG